MKVVPNLVGEFEEVCAHYQSRDARGKDIVTLVKKFGDTYDHLSSEEDLRAAWDEFLKEHQHQVEVYPVLGLILYNLITYWDTGQMLFRALPTLEKMLVRDVVADISDEIRSQSADNGYAVLTVDDAL